MKFFVVALALFAVANAVPQTKSLKDDLQEFLDLIPAEDIKAVARRYLANDAEFQAVVVYLQGPEWAKFVSEVAAHPTWQEFKTYLQESGIDIDAILNFIHDLILGGPTKGLRVQRSIRDFVDEVLALIPKDELLILLNNKLQNSADFQEFYDKISGEKAHQLAKEVIALPEVQRVAQRLRELGIDVDKVIALVKAFLGWVR